MNLVVRILSSLVASAAGNSNNASSFASAAYGLLSAQGDENRAKWPGDVPPPTSREVCRQAWLTHAMCELIEETLNEQKLADLLLAAAYGVIPSPKRRTSVVVA